MLHLRRFPQSGIWYCHHCRRHLCNSVDIFESDGRKPVFGSRPLVDVIIFIFEKRSSFVGFCMALVVLFEFQGESDVQWCLANQVHFCLGGNPNRYEKRRVEICLSKFSIADSDSLKLSDRSSNDEPGLVFSRDWLVDSSIRPRQLSQPWLKIEEYNLSIEILYF